MEIDGNKFQEMCVSAANSLDSQKTEINNLNVFPVPDGDTGINMSLTMKPVREIHVEPGTLSEAAGRVAEKVLRAARGNSGAILSLFFRGMAKSFKGLDKADSKDIAKAIRSGTNEAYRAVGQPTEGTILTVMRGTADTAEAESELYQGDPEAFFERLVDSAEEVLRQTPEMLPVLKQAKVVDAGGSGFVTMLKGMLASLKGEGVEAGESDDAVETADAADFAEIDPDSIKFAYCTECIIAKSEEFAGEGTGEAFKNTISPLGDSMVFVDDEQIIKVHIHTNDPGRVLSEAVKYGSLETVKVENMRNQHHALTAAGEQAAEEAAAAAAAAQVAAECPELDKPVGFVAVCMGDGVAATFRDLGVNEIVTGGQTMNPSTEDILRAVNRTPAETVFVFPNNKNIIMAAEQCIPLTDRRVIVIPSKTIPQGVSALMNYDPDADVDSLQEAFTEALASVHTTQVTYAARDSDFDGHDIKAGEYLALLDGQLIDSTKSKTAVLRKLCQAFKPLEPEFINVYYGADVPEKQAKAAAAAFTAEFADAEVNLIYGGQPVYYYIISVE